MHAFDKLLLYRRVFGSAWLPNACRGFLSSGPVAVAFTPPGLSHPLRLRLKTSDVATYVKVFLEEEYAFELPADPAVIVDAGANVGVTSVWLAHRHPRARILALEPEPTNYELLRENVTPYPGVVPIRAALWSFDGDVVLVDPGLGHWAFRVAPAGASPAAARVPALSVGALLDQYGLDRIDLLKVDIEGAEAEVFGGSPPWLERVDAIAIELHDRWRPGCSRAVFGATGAFTHEAWRGENLFLSRTLPRTSAGGD